MSQPGIRAEVAISSPDDCPVATASATTDADASDVARSEPEDGGRVVEEFTVGTSETATESVPEGMDKVFESSDTARYRFEREPNSCVCETVESLGSPVSDVRAEDGTLVVTVHAPDVEQVRSVVSELREAYDDVVLRLLQRTDDDAQEDLVLVDRGALTDRQREVLETAASMGYFEYPKGANASEVAEALDISLSTFAEHLAAAQTKLFGDIVDS